MAPSGAADGGPSKKAKQNDQKPQMSEGKQRKKRLLLLNKQIASYGQRKQLGKALEICTQIVDLYTDSYTDPYLTLVSTQRLLKSIHRLWMWRGSRLN